MNLTNTNISVKAEKSLLTEYLTRAEISETQEKAFKMSNELAQTMPDHAVLSQILKL